VQPGLVGDVAGASRRRIVAELYPEPRGGTQAAFALDFRGGNADAPW
jgi:hypothetical protein